MSPSSRKPHWLAHAFHILESIERIQGQADIDIEQMFDPSSIVYDGLLRRLQTLADASREIPRDIQKKHPHINWSNIAGFRNILAHDYLGDLDEDVLRAIVSEQLPILYQAVLSHVPNWEALKAKNSMH